MTKRILTLVAVVATAGLIMAWGCGGKALEGPGEGWTGETTPVIITAGAGTGSAPVAAVTKDFGGEARADSDEGDVDSSSGSLTMTCDIDFGALTTASVPIVPLTVARGHGAADCTANPPCNVNKYLACWVEKQAGDSWCTAYCEGIYPKRIEYEDDLIPLTITFTTSIADVAGVTDPAAVLFRQDGRRTNEYGMPIWAELDTGIGSLVSIIDDAGANYGFGECDGDGGTMAMTGVDPFDLDPGTACEVNEDCLDADSEGVRNWRKNFTVSALGNGDCVLYTIIVGELTVDGVMTNSVDLARDPVILASKWCDERADCTAMGSWTTFSMTYQDADTNPVIASATGVNITEIQANFPELMSADSFTNNIYMEIVSPFVGQPALDKTLVFENNPASAVRIVPSNAHIAAGQEIRLVMDNITNADITKIQDVPVVFTFTAAGSGSDGFYNNTSLASYFFYNEDLGGATVSVPYEGNLTLAQATGFSPPLVSYPANLNVVRVDESGVTVNENKYLTLTKSDISITGMPLAVVLTLSSFTNSFADYDSATNRDALGVIVSGVEGNDYFFFGLEAQSDDTMAFVAYSQDWDTDHWVPLSGVKIPYANGSYASFRFEGSQNGMVMYLKLTQNGNYANMTGLAGAVAYFPSGSGCLDGNNQPIDCPMALASTGGIPLADISMVVGSAASGTKNATADIDEFRIMGDSMSSATLYPPSNPQDPIFIEPYVGFSIAE